MRNNYWTCSKFADWLRGTDKPWAETSKGWRVWREAARTAHPVRYWLADTGLDMLQNFLMWPIDRIYDVKYYINNRWVTRTHCLTAHSRDIRPGTWCDVGNRFLPCLFNELVDFVEVELAWWQIAWNDDGKKKYDAPFWSKGWFRWRTWRSAQAGLDNLDWQSKLIYDDEWIGADDPNYGKFTPQAIKAQEILELYTWWTLRRPARPDPDDVSGWSAICDLRSKQGRSLDLESRTDDEREESRLALDMVSKLEAEYEQEDTDMLIRLIKIRQGLWT